MRPAELAIQPYHHVDGILQIGLIHQLPEWDGNRLKVYGPATRITPAIDRRNRHQAANARDGQCREATDQFLLARFGGCIGRGHKEQRISRGPNGEIDLQGRMKSRSLTPDPLACFPVEGLGEMQDRLRFRLFL